MNTPSTPMRCHPCLWLGKLLFAKRGIYTTGSATVGFIVPGFLSQFDGSEQKLSEL
jgi:hypothetical protein